MDFRKHFGHLDIDKLVGARDKEVPVLFTKIERKTRFGNHAKN